MLTFKNFFFEKNRIWIKRLKHTFGLIIALSSCVNNNFDLPEFFSIKLTFEIVDKERWNVGLAFEIMVCNMQILKVERSDTSLIQGQFSNVCWRLGGGEKKMNIDLTLQLGKKPSHLTQKTPSFCWIFGMVVRRLAHSSTTRLQSRPLEQSDK